jgi:hypothetical protein
MDQSTNIPHQPHFPLQRFFRVFLQFYIVGQFALAGELFTMMSHELVLCSCEELYCTHFFLTSSPGLYIIRLSDP